MEIFHEMDGTDTLRGGSSTGQYLSCSNEPGFGIHFAFTLHFDRCKRMGK